MDIHQIWNLLFAGKKLEIPFHSTKDAEYLRIQLHRLKRAEESTLLAAEFITLGDVKSLSFIVSHIEVQAPLPFTYNEESEPELLVDIPEQQPQYVASIQLVQKKRSTSYIVKIIED